MKKKLNIAIFGDSLVSCSQLNKKNRWIEILKNKFRYKFKFYIFSYNGATTDDALKKITSIFKIKRINIFFFVFGTNDSVYYMSMKGKPRVNLKKFSNNFLKMIYKINDRYKPRIIFLTSHKFLRKRLEGNKKTHNHSYKKYRKEIFKISKKLNYEVIDLYKNLKKYSPSKYCLPLPDGLHLNNYGSFRYSYEISRFLKNKILKKNI